VCHSVVENLFRWHARVPDGACHLQVTPQECLPCLSTVASIRSCNCSVLARDTGGAFFLLRRWCVECHRVLPFACWHVQALLCGLGMNVRGRRRCALMGGRGHSGRVILWPCCAALRCVCFLAGTASPCGSAGVVQSPLAAAKAGHASPCACLETANVLKVSSILLMCAFFMGGAVGGIC
jgi:hypothetical protein